MKLTNCLTKVGKKYYKTAVLKIIKFLQTHNLDFNEIWIRAGSVVCCQAILTIAVEVYETHFYSFIVLVTLRRLRS